MSLVSVENGTIGTHHSSVQSLMSLHDIRQCCTEPVRNHVGNPAKRTVHSGIMSAIKTSFIYVPYLQFHVNDIVQ